MFGAVGPVDLGSGDGPWFAGVLKAAAEVLVATAGLGSREYELLVVTL